MPAEFRELPLIAVLTTGGTIAAAPAESGRPADYHAGALSAAAVLASADGLEKHVRIEVTEVSAIGSEDMTDEVWLRLLAAADRQLARPDIAGAVVVHGTDTLEETAFFLHLTLNSRKPLVLTAAMRPPHSLSADGPRNLFQAAVLAASPEAAGKGVLVLMNDRIHSARDIAKTDTLAPEAFQSPNAGPLGRMLGGDILSLRAPVRPHTADSPFCRTRPEELPRVEILYGHAGQRRELADAAAAAGTDGIVHAGVGMGNVHASVLPALTEAAASGIPVVCSSRLVSGPVPLRAEMRRNGFVSASDLNPQKARVLLQLALTVTAETKALQRYFDEL